VGQRRLETGLTRSKNATGTWGEGEEKTWAEREEENGRHDEIVAGENETHGASDEAVDEEEDEGVEEDSHLVGLAVHERHLGAVGGQKNTGAERQKKGGRDSDFLGSDIGEHLIYVHIIFGEIHEMIKRSTSHHLFVKSIIIDDSPDTRPYVMELIFMFTGNTFMIRIVFLEAKLHKITKLPRMCDVGVVHQCIDCAPHVP